MYTHHCRGWTLTPLCISPSPVDASSCISSLPFTRNHLSLLHSAIAVAHTHSPLSILCFLTQGSHRSPDLIIMIPLSCPLPSPLPSGSCITTREQMGPLFFFVTLLPFLFANLYPSGPVFFFLLSGRKQRTNVGCSGYIFLCASARDWKTVIASNVRTLNSHGSLISPDACGRPRWVRVSFRQPCARFQDNTAECHRFIVQRSITVTHERALRVGPSWRVRFPPCRSGAISVLDGRVTAEGAAGVRYSCG